MTAIKPTNMSASALSCPHHMTSFHTTSGRQKSHSSHHQMWSKCTNYAMMNGQNLTRDPTMLPQTLKSAARGQNLTRDPTMLPQTIKSAGRGQNLTRDPTMLPQTLKTASPQFLYCWCSLIDAILVLFIIIIRSPYDIIQFCTT